MREQVPDGKDAPAAQPTATPAAAGAEGSAALGQGRELAGGAALGAGTRARFEQSLGADLSGVRVHTDSAASASAAEHGAHAFAVDQDIYGPASALDPGSAGGMETLAHEVIHTVQASQAGAAAPMASSKSVSKPTDAAEVEASSGAAAVAAGQPFSPSATPVASISRDAADIEAAIDDTTQSAADVIQVISRQYPSDQSSFLGNAARRTKLVNRLNGNQMVQVINLVSRFPWSADLGVQQINLVRRAGGANGIAVQQIVRGLDWSHQVEIYVDADAMAYLRGLTTGGPMSLFTDESTGITSQAESSAHFMEWFVADHTPAEILRVLGDTAVSSTLVAALSATTNGWAWLDALPGGSGLTTEQSTALTNLRTGTSRGSAERQRIDDKLSQPPLATNPADAKRQLDALLATSAPDEQSVVILVGALSAADKTALAADLNSLKDVLSGPNFTQVCRLLNLDLSTTLGALRDAGQTDPTSIQDVIGPAPVADRVAVAGDASLAHWIIAMVPNQHPMAIFGVQAGEEEQFLPQEPFGMWLLLRMNGTPLLELLGNSAWATEAGALLDRNFPLALAWISTLPPAAQLGIEARPDMSTPKHHGAASPTETQIRMLRMTVSNAMVQQAIDTHLGDTVSPDSHATQSSASPDELNYESPRERLDAALEADDQAGILDAVGALQGAERDAVRDNADGVLFSMAWDLDDENYYQAMHALDHEPKWQIYYLVSAEWGGGGPARFQGIIGHATDAEKADIIGWNTVASAVRDEIDGGPLPVFGMSDGVPDWALRKPEFCDWFVTDTHPLEVLRVIEPSAAPVLDTQWAWAWLDELPDHAAAYSQDERDKLQALKDNSANVFAVMRLHAIISNAENTASSPADALVHLEDELLTPFADEEACICYANQLDAGGRSSIIAGQKDYAAINFNTEEMARFVIALQMPLLKQVEWLFAAGTPAAAELQMLLDRASPADQLALLDDVDQVVNIRSVLDTAPAMALPGLAIADATKLYMFWSWTLEKVEPYEALRVLAQSSDVNHALFCIGLAKGEDYFDTLPKGIGLAPPARQQIDGFFPSLSSQDQQKKFFAIRFDAELSGGWADASGPTGGDLKALYAQLTRLPLEQVANNRFLERFNRTGAGTGGSYTEGDERVNIGANQTSTKTLYDGEPHQYTEQYFDHTVRHEVGHAVDAALGGRTSLCFDYAGWYEYPEGSAEQFVQDLGGFTDSAGGATLTGDEKDAIVEALASFMNSAAARISGPGRSIFTMLPDDHVLNARPTLKIAQALRTTGGKMHYHDPYDDGSKVWSINYYYQRWMKVNSAAANSAPRDYTLFAPAEYFADMYAEFYRGYDGTPATEGALGGNVPGPVATWLMNNVHTIGYDSHNRRDASGPRTGVHGG